MKKFLLFAFISVISFSALAQTFSFPSSAPEFNITFPNGWKSETEDGILSAYPKDESIYVGLWELSDSETMETAMDALATELDKIITAEEMGEPEEVILNGLTIIAFDGKGVEKESGGKLNFSVAVFSPQGKSFYILLYFGTEESENKYQKDLNSIITSLKKI